MNQQSYRRRREEGFTLIELLVVIVILGILSAIVVFSVQGITDRGEGAACEASAQTVRVAAQAHYAQNGNYAADLAALETAGFISEYPVAPAGNVLTVNGGTITYVPGDGSVTDTCTSGGGGGGGATTTTAGGGGGGGTTTTSTTTTTAPAACAYVAGSEVTPDVNANGGGPSFGQLNSGPHTFSVRTTGTCGTITMVVQHTGTDTVISGFTSGTVPGQPTQTQWSRTVQNNTYSSWREDQNVTVSIQNNGAQIATGQMDID